jgi:hypothetical protein
LEAVQLEQRTHQQRGLYTRDQLHAFELLRSHLRAIFKASDETYSWAEILQAFSTMEQIPWPRLSLPDDELIEKAKNVSVFARIEPLHKLKIVNAFKKSGNALEVAMLDPEDLRTIEFIKKKANLKHKIFNLKLH